MAVAVSLLTACSSSITEPVTMHAPTTPRLVEYDCFVDCATNVNPDGGYVNLDTLSLIVDRNIDQEVALFGDLPFGPAAAYTPPPPPPECSTTVHDYTEPFTQEPARLVERSASCPGGPCYTQYLDYRDAFRTTVAGGVVGGTTTAATFLWPGGGFAVRIVKTLFGFVGTVGFIGWSNNGREQTARVKMDQCLANNGAYYMYHVTIIK